MIAPALPVEVEYPDARVSDEAVELVADWLLGIVDEKAGADDSGND